jgi:hypothetical protein
VAECLAGVGASAGRGHHSPTRGTCRLVAISFGLSHRADALRLDCGRLCKPELFQECLEGNGLWPAPRRTRRREARLAGSFLVSVWHATEPPPPSSVLHRQRQARRLCHR